MDIGVNGERRVVLESVELLTRADAGEHVRRVEVHLELRPHIRCGIAVLDEVAVLGVDLAPEIREREVVDTVPSSERSRIGGLGSGDGARKAKGLEVHLDGLGERLPVVGVEDGHVIEEGSQ